MKARRFEEVLEECLTAHLEGRRTLEESLSLYPSLARELEPLLRTASSVTDAFDRNSPPRYVIERGRERFLAAASTRARARALTARMVLDHRSRPWGVRIWGAMGTAAAAVVAAAAIGAAVLLGGSDGGQSVGVGTVGDGTAPAVLNLGDLEQANIRLKEAATTGSRIEPDTLVGLKAMMERLKNVDPATLTETELQDLGSVVVEQHTLLAAISDSPAGAEQSDEVIFLLSSAAEVAKKLGLELPVFSPAASPTPAPATPVPTPAPAETPAPTLPPLPTPEPAPAPTAAPEGPGEPTPPVFQPS